jgi:membrane protein
VVKFKRAIHYLKLTISEWGKDHVPRLGAALAFYSVFSLAPLLFLAITLSGFIFGHDAARSQVMEQLHGLVGEDVAGIIATVSSENADKPQRSIIATVAGVVALLAGAFGVFGQLKGALNSIWDVTPKPSAGIFGAIRKRFFSFLTLLGTGFLLLVSLVISAGLAAATQRISHGSGFSATAVGIIEFIVSLGVTTAIFALIFKVLPDLKIAWDDVWIGAAMTAFLFTVGKSLIGLYIGRSSAASAYGAAGSIVILMMWVFYSAQILLFGAEFTHVYANRNNDEKTRSETMPPK